ncbi:MAG: hypothetical protein ABIZ70_07145 [Gemmatimonadales bacterium]
MADGRLGLAQRAGGLGFIALAVRSLLNSGDSLALKPVIWLWNWPVIAEGLGATLLAYAILIWSTGEIIRGWEYRISVASTIRLWVRSNLARYVPRWSGLPLRLVSIAEEEIFRAKLVTGSALHPPLVWLGTGSVTAGVLLAFYRYGNTKIYLPLLLIGALAILVVTFGLAGTDLPRRIGQALGRPETMRPADAEALGIGIFANFAAWVIAGYGLSLLAEGLLVGVHVDWMLVTGALAAATVIGYLLLLLPTGLLVREAVLYALIKPQVSAGPALAIALSYRVVLTTFDILLSSFLLLRRPSRDAA